MIRNVLSTIKSLLLLLLLLSCNDTASKAQARVQARNEAAKIKWVDSVYHTLSQDEQIGQLFMIAAYSGGPKQNEPFIRKLITEHHIGGLIFMQGTAEAQAVQTNAYQNLSKVPLLIGMDAEWGLGMRLTGVKNFPRQMMLGAGRDESLVYEMGRLIAEQCKLLGVHINFAPDADINNNPANPVINFRSFGEDRQWVSRLGIAYMKGMQDNGVMASAKHFPGHGDVHTDSHLDLPLISKTQEELQAMELYPFKQLADSGVASIMVAHLSLPALEPEKGLPSTLSYNIITKLLKDDMQYKGLIITDALNMEGLTKYYPSGEADLKAFLAGNDILLFSQDVSLAVKKIRESLANGAITEQRLAHSVKKILSAKYDAGLHKTRVLDTAGLTVKLNEKVIPFKKKAAAASITLVRDHNHTLYQLGAKKVGYLAVNGNGDAFFEELKKNLPHVVKLKTVSQMKEVDYVIAGLHEVALYPGKGNTYGVQQGSIKDLEAVSKASNAIVIVFGNAYATKYLCNAGSLVVAYEEDESTYEAAAKVLSGRRSPKGKLPVSACK